MGCHFLLQCMRVKSESEVAQSCPTLQNPMDCSPPGSSVHGISQVKIPERVAISSSRGSSRSSGQTHVSHTSCTGRRILYHGATGRCKMPFGSQGHHSSWWESSFVGRWVLEALWGRFPLHQGLGSVTRWPPLYLKYHKRGKPQASL